MPKVLLVEDNNLEIKLFIESLRMLEKEWDLEIAENGIKAMNVLSKKNKSMPDIILLDLKLPKLKGIDVLRRIKKNKRMKSIPVIITTTSSASDDYKETMELGAKAFLTKPQNLSEYKAYINDIEKCF